MLASLTRLEFGALTAAMLLAPNLVASSSLFGSLAQVKGSAYRHARALDVSINLAHAKRQLGGSSNSTYFTPVGASNSSCTTCTAFIDDQTPCASNSTDFTCSCKTKTLQDFITCEECEMDSDITSYPGGLKGFITDALTTCSALGLPVSGISTDGLPTNNVSQGPGAFTSSGGVTSVGSGDLGNAGDCNAVCNAVCRQPVSGRMMARQATKPSSLDLSCSCTQAYFDSMYQCFACGTAAFGGDTTLQQSGVESLKGLQQACANAGYKGISTQDGLASYNPSSTVFGSATSGSNATSDAGKTTSASTSSSTSSQSSKPGGGSGGAVALSPRLALTVACPVVLALATGQILLA